MKKQDNSKTGKWFFLSIGAFGIVAICSFCMIWQYGKRQNSENIYQELQVIVNEVDGESEENIIEPIVSEETELSISYPEKNLDWDALRKENPDIYAWIYVSNTTIDYPVLQHPQDNTYYLEHNIDGTEGYPGCIYTENYNSKDFTDVHTVIYGHNLKDNTMFAPLHEFEDEERVKENQYIYIYTKDYVYIYQIFAAYEFNGIHLLANYDLDNEYVYEQYIKDIFNMKNTSSRVTNIREDISVTKDDRIVTLSTCTKNPDTRFLVAGVLINP